MATGSSGSSALHKTRFTPLGTIPLDSCATAVPENLIVNLTPSLSSVVGSSKKRNNDEIPETSEPKAHLGCAHLDTFFIHEVASEPDSKEFSTRQVQSIQLPSSLHNRCVVFRAKWVTVTPAKSVMSGTVLVLCTNLAAYFFNDVGTKQLLKFEYDSSQGGANIDPMDISKCSRAIAATGENILLGNDRGHVLVFTCEMKSKGKGGSSTGGSISLQLYKSMKLCSEPIAELCARKNGLVVVGISTGSLSVWTGFQEEEGGVSQPAKVAEYVLSKPETVTSIILWYPYAIASYGSGVIRLFNLVQKVLSAQVFAHSRWISSMDLCVRAGLLLSIAEDDEVRIWELRRRHKGEQKTPIKLYSSIRIEDVNLIGGKFLNYSGTLIGFTNLGSKDIAVYGSGAGHHKGFSGSTTTTPT